jgi:hypothetical protein
MIGLAQSADAKDVRIALVDIVGKYPPRFVPTVKRCINVTHCSRF